MRIDNFLYRGIYFSFFPYKFKKFTHEQLNSYSEPSIPPFDTNLTPDLFFRDVNYWFFHEENFERMKYFYLRNFPHLSLPWLWISIPYSFIEHIFLFPWTVQFSGLKIQKNNLFRSLSHITGDNNLPAWKRKFILLDLIIHWSALICIPFLPHYILLSFISFLSRRDIAMSSYQDSPNKESWPYIWVNENNLIGRKGNRYMINSQEYYFHVDSVDNDFITWTGKIVLRKSIQSQENFPFVGKYNFSINVVKSEHFTFLGWSNMVLSFLPREDFVHDIPFLFHLPKKGLITFFKQACLQNTEILVSMDTPPFWLLPKTNLLSQKDNWHFTRWVFKKDVRLKYEIFQDSSPLRMVYRWIINNNTVQITFQKPIEELWEFRFTYEWKDIPCSHLEFLDKWKILIFHLDKNIPTYPFSERKKVLKVEISNIKDTSWFLHYVEKPRVIWFPWTQKLSSNLRSES